MASIPCTDTGSSVMLLGAAWGSDPGGRCWGFVSRKSSCQASLGRGMLEGLLICHSFERDKFSCVAISECSSTRFFNFLGLRPSSCAPQWRMCRQIPHGTGGKHSQFCYLIVGSLNLRGMGSVQDIFWSSPLVPIWASLQDLDAVGLLVQRRGIPR